MNDFSAFFAIIKREIGLNLGKGGGAFLPTAFFAGAILILPFAIGPDPELLKKIGPGFLWLALSLAALVSLERLFQSDIDDGSFEQLFISPLPLSIIMLAKVLGQWFSVAVPMMIAAPIAGLMVNIPESHVLELTFILFIGSLAMFMLGAIGAALGASVKRGGLLVALLALPLYTPIVIFGAASAAQLIDGQGFFNQGTLFIFALAAFSLVLSPVAISASMKLNLD